MKEIIPNGNREKIRPLMRIFKKFIKCFQDTGFKLEEISDLKKHCSFKFLQYKITLGPDEESKEENITSRKNATKPKKEDLHLLRLLCYEFSNTHFKEFFETPLYTRAFLVLYEKCKDFPNLADREIMDAIFAEISKQGNL